MAIKSVIPTKLKDTLSFLDSIDEEGKQWRDTWSKNWDRNAAILRNDIWPDMGNKALFTSNIISPAIRRKSALLTESKPQIDIRVRKEGFQATSIILKNVCNALWDEQFMAMAMESLAFYLGAFGCGFWKISYDRNADFGNGNIIISAVDPRMMRIDPSITKAYELHKAQYIIEDSIVALSDLQRTFGAAAKDVRADTRINMLGPEQHKLSWYNRVMANYFMSKDRREGESPVPRVWTREYWIADPATDEDGTPKYPGGRRIVRTGDDTVLEDPDEGQENPFFDGLWPYEMLDNEPDLDHPWGHAEIEALKKLNEAFNRIGHVVTKTTVRNVPWVIADNNALDKETIQDLKELEEVVVEKGAGRQVEHVPATQPTQFSTDFMRYIVSLVEMSVGLSDGAMQGKGRVELRSAPQLEGLQQASQVLVRAQARRLESFLERVGQKLISRIFQFYTDDRIMVYNGENEIKEYNFQKDKLRAEILMQAEGAAEQMALDQTNENLQDGMSLSKAAVDPKDLNTPEHIFDHVKGAWRNFRFKIIPYSSMSSTKIQRAAMVQQLAAQGMLPTSLVLQEAGFENYKELWQETIQELKLRQSMGFPPPGGGQQKKGGGKK